MTFNCDQCHYKSYWRSKLAGHVQAVHEGIKYNCDQCDYTAIPKRLFIRHKQHEHEDMKCDKCEHKMVGKKNLLRNKLFKHKGIKYRPGKFVCNQCSTPFTSSRGLRLHQRSEHEGVTYDCDQCDYKATQQIHVVVSMKESNTIGTSVTLKALPSLILEGTKRQNMRLFDPPVQIVQYVQF